MASTLTHRSGGRRHVVQVQTRTAAQDAYGEAILTWTTVHARNVEIKSLSGTELIEARKIQANATHWITMLYDNQVTPQSRFVWGSRTFEILHVVNPEERNKLYNVLVREKVV